MTLQDAHTVSCSRAVFPLCLLPSTQQWAQWDWGAGVAVYTLEDQEPSPYTGWRTFDIRKQYYPGLLSLEPGLKEGSASAKVYGVLLKHRNQWWSLEFFSYYLNPNPLSLLKHCYLPHLAALLSPALPCPAGPGNTISLSLCLPQLRNIRLLQSQASESVSVASRGRPSSSSHHHRHGEMSSVLPLCSCQVICRHYLHSLSMRQTLLLNSLYHEQSGTWRSGVTCLMPHSKSVVDLEPNSGLSASGSKHWAIMLKDMLCNASQKLTCCSRLGQAGHATWRPLSPNVTLSPYPLLFIRSLTFQILRSFHLQPQRQSLFQEEEIMAA